MPINDFDQSAAVDAAVTQYSSPGGTSVTPTTAISGSYLLAYSANYL